MTITDVLKEFENAPCRNCGCAKSNHRKGGCNSTYKQGTEFCDCNKYKPDIIPSIESAFEATRVEERIGTHVPPTEIEMYLFHERNGRNQVVREQKALEDKFMERSTDGK